MRKFSERIGKVEPRKVFQIDEIDNDLKNSLWNIFLEEFYIKHPDNNEVYGTRGNMAKIIWRDFLKLTVDSIPRSTLYSFSSPVFVKDMKRWFLHDASWHKIYDFIEFIVHIDPEESASLCSQFNFALEREMSGYRFVNSYLAPIINASEIAEIENALDNTQHFKSVNTHLDKSLSMLADKSSPDVRNSIKESISAVEAYCKIITNDSSATLGKMLNEIEKSHQLHGALKSAFSSLYGFTSDAGGIRHSLLEGDVELTISDATFMLVICSAFLNYLQAKFDYSRPIKEE